MNRTQLYIKIRGQWQELDLTDDVSIPLTLTLSDVKDPSKVKTSFSKTISIPDTNNNRDLLEGLYDSNNEITSNINTNMEAYLSRDTIPIFEGRIRFDKVRTSNNRKFTYQATLINDSNSFFKSVGEKLLTDLDFSEYNHTYTTTNIVNTWTASNFGYYYPLIDYNYGLTKNELSNIRISAECFRPALYLKNVVDKIISDSGYTYESDFFNNDELYNNALIPFAGNTERLSGFDVENDSVFIGLSSTQSVTYSVAGIIPKNTYIGSTRRIEFDNENLPYIDNSNYWDSSNYEYVESGDLKRHQFTINLDFWLNEFDINQIVSNNGGFSIQVKLRRSSANGPKIPLLVGNSGTSSVSNYVLLSQQSVVGAFYPPTPGNFGTSNIIDTRLLGGQTQSRFSGQIKSVPLDGNAGFGSLPLLNGEKVWVEIETGVYTGDNFNIASLGYLLELNNTSFDGVIPPTEIYNEIVDTRNIPYLGYEINMNSVLPDKIKQKDFLTSVVKMFNLYIDVDKLNKKKLKIEPRNDFYRKGTIKDWSNKLDISKSIEQELIIDKNSSFLFNHKNDNKDLYLSEYTADTESIWGEYEKNIEGEYKSSNQVISTIFTPSVETSLEIDGTSKVILPRFLTKTSGNSNSTKQGEYKGGLRILLRNKEGRVQLPANERFFIFGLNYTYYPYVGHFNHPFESEYDINFGLTKYLGYDAALATLNNLYNRYWRDYIEELIDVDSRIIKAYIKLDPSDINSLNLNDLIRINQLASSTTSLLKIIKVEYDPGKKDNVLVEFLKSKNFNFKNNNRVPTFTRPGIRPTKPNGPFEIVDDFNIGNNNNWGSGRVMMVGQGNTIQPNGNNLFIFGDDNWISARNNYVGIMASTSSSIYSGNERSMIIGSEFSTIESDTKSSFIFGGSNNKIGLGVTNSFIFGGDGVNLTQSNVSYFQNKVIVNSIEDLSGNPIGGLNIPFTITGSNTLFGVDNNNIYFIGDNFYLTASNIFLNGTVSFGNEIITGDASGGGVVINPNSTTASISIKSDNNVITFGDEAPNYVGSTGESNMLFGKGGQFDLTTGVENTVFGYNSGNNMTTDDRNVFVGSNIAPNTSGADENTAIGYNSMNALSSGNFNIGVGSRSLESITIGSSNISIGVLSGFSVTSADNNILVGFEAGTNLINGDNNVAIGYGAGQNFTSAQDAVAIGFNAFSTKSTGQGGVAIGYRAGLNTTQANTLLGFQTGLNLSTGASNVFLGAQVGQYSLGSFATGSRNILIGNDIGPNPFGSDPQPNNTLAFGNDITIEESNSINLGSTTYPYNTSATFSGVTASYLEVYVNGTKYKIPLYT